MITSTPIEDPPPIARADDPSFGRLDLSLSAGFASTTFAPIRQLTIDDAPIPSGPLHVEGRHSEITGQVRLTGNIALRARVQLGTQIWTNLDPSLTAAELAGPAHALDPQLGDAAFGGSVSIVFRWITGRWLLDVGVAQMWSSFQWRQPLNSASGVYGSNPSKDGINGINGINQSSGVTVIGAAYAYDGFLIAAGWDNGLLPSAQPEFALVVGCYHADFEGRAGFAYNLDFDAVAHVGARVSDD
jgi:hypothetical protein